MALTKPQPPKRPDIYKYRETEKLNFDFSSFKDAILYLFFGCLAIGYLISGNEIVNFIHGIVLLIGVGLGFAGLYLFFHSFKLEKRTVREPKSQNELKNDKTNYDAAFIIYEQELNRYNQRLKEEQELREREEKRKQEEERKQQVLAEQMKIVEQQQKEREEQQQKQNKISAWQAKLNALSTEYRQDWREFVEILEENQITKLYHFTDKSNLASIKSCGGLYSWWAAQQKGIIISKPGGVGFGRDLDVRKGLQNYVRLSFNNKNPMLYVAQKEGRVLNPIFLEIDPIVMLLASTLFTKENATKNGVYPSSTLQFFKEIVEGTEGDALYSFRKLLGGGFLINPKAEILVLEKIPLQYITNITSI